MNSDTVDMIFCVIILILMILPLMIYIYKSLK